MEYDKKYTIEDYFSLLYKNNPNATFLMKVESGNEYQCVFVNKSYCDLTKREEKNVIGKRIEEILPSGHSSFVIKKYEEAIETKCSIQFEEKMQLAYKECIMNTTITPILDEEKKCIYIFGVFYDVTEVKQKENALRENEEKYRKLFELDLNGIFIVERESGKIVDINRSGTRIYGYSYEEFLKLNIRDISSEPLKTMETIREVIDHIPLRYHKKRDGTLFPIEATTTNFILGGRELVIFTIRDLSHLKKVQDDLNEAKEYDKIKTEFLANISHELRTPLNIILGYTQLFDGMANKNPSTEMGKKQFHYVNGIKQNSYRLLRLINNIIDITKIDANYLELHRAQYNIVNIIEDITFSVVEYAKLKGLSLQFDTNCEEKTMCFDKEKIERIMLNLLSNAIKFTEAGGKIKVVLEVEREWVTIRVKDSGIGIPENKIDIIFERFRQVNKGFIRDHEGSGIGLSLVKSLVEMHNGTVTVNSEYEKGSEFIIRLPAHLLCCEESVFSERSLVMQEKDHLQKTAIEFADIDFK